MFLCLFKRDNRYFVFIFYFTVIYNYTTLHYEINVWKTTH